MNARYVFASSVSYFLKKISDFLVPALVVLLTYFVGERLLLKYQEISFKNRILFETSLQLISTSAEYANDLYVDVLRIEDSVNRELQNSQASSAVVPSEFISDELKEIMARLSWFEIAFLGDIRENQIETELETKINKQILSARNHVDKILDCMYNFDETCPSRFERDRFREIAISLNQYILAKISDISRQAGK